MRGELRPTYQVYLSKDIWRGFWLLAKARNSGAPGTSIHTIESLVDEILRKELTEKHPQVFEHQLQIDKLERELLKNL
jgi:hypothetical protein